jgi:phosphoenolpyruvate synthase/pyruvate phosphate dikinase
LEDLFNILNDLLKNVRKDKDYLKFLLDKDEEICKNVLEFYEKLDCAGLKELSDENLARMYKDVNLKYSYLLGVSHMIEGFTQTTEEKIRELVERNEKKSGKELMKVLISPSSHSLMSIEHNKLYKIVKEIKKLGISKIDDKVLENNEIKKMIDEHARKYFWKNNGFSCVKILGTTDFVDEINDIIEKDVDVDEKINEFEAVSGNKKKKEEVLKEIGDFELKELIEIGDAIFRIHDRRKEHMTISLHYLNLLHEEAAKRFNVDVELVRFARVDELTKVGEIVDELKSRKKKSVFVFFPDEEYVFTGDIAEEYINELTKQRDIEIDDVIKGNGASLGKVTGKVKVCRGVEEISKMEEGCVLVACMTQPEFVPAMKKAIAIVTDEGGLTCHAAIISRELGIPCVIGTKVATQVLKDGEIVEVDADKGIVRKLKD